MAMTRIALEESFTDPEVRYGNEIGTKINDTMWLRH